MYTQNMMRAIFLIRDAHMARILMFCVLLVLSLSFFLSLSFLFSLACVRKVICLFLFYCLKKSTTNRVSTPHTVSEKEFEHNCTVSFSLSVIFPYFFYERITRGYVRISFPQTENVPIDVCWVCAFLNACFEKALYIQTIKSEKCSAHYTRVN
jgi:hypothetical protein